MVVAVESVLEEQIPKVGICTLQLQLQMFLECATIDESDYNVFMFF
jgi:hypothetical protein